VADKSDGRKWGFLEEDGGILVCPFHNGSFTLFFHTSCRWGENKLRSNLRKSRSKMLHLKLWLNLKLNETHTLKPCFNWQPKVNFGG
jgi:hypothetical protein